MQFDNTAAQLHAAIAAVCPIHGVSIGRKDDKSTWRIDFVLGATSGERADAEAVLAAFDVAAAATAEQAKRTRAAAVDAKLRALAERMVDDPGLMDRLTQTR